MPSISVVIPTLNEVLAIPSVFAMLKELKESADFVRQFSKLEIVVVDDGSTDGSQELLQRQSEIKYLRHSTRQGYGASLKTGFQNATGDFIFFIDMDASYDPLDLLILYDALRNDSADVVFGNRLARQSGMPRIRQIGNRTFSFLVRSFANSPITDVCTGFRLFHRVHLPLILSVPENELNYSMALTLRLIRSHLKLTERAIRYYEREGHSKLNVLEDGFAFLSCILKSRYG